VAPFFIDREKDAAAADTANVSNEAVGGLTIVSFPNSHLVYALTWFALAIGAAGGAWLLLRRGPGVAP
jgi:surfeit locus 1 family protein